MKHTLFNHFMMIRFQNVAIFISNYLAINSISTSICNLIPSTVSDDESTMISILLTST